MATTIYDIGITAFRELLADDYDYSRAYDVSVGDYVVTIGACSMGTIYFQAPAFVNCHGLESALDFVKWHEENDRVEHMAYEYEVWHVVGNVIDPSCGSFYVSLSDEVCGTPNIVHATEIGYAEFSTYDAAESFAIRNVCESIPSVLVSYYYDTDDRYILEPLRFLRWVGGPSGHDVRFGNFFGSKCPEFRFPTKNGSLLSAIRGGAR